MLSDQQALAINDLAAMAGRTSEHFGEQVYIVGTMSQLLDGINIEPRDIDLLLPSSVDVDPFIDHVFTPLGYKDVGDFCWRRPDRYSGENSLHISHPNFMHERNFFAADPDNAFGWDFDDRLWQSVEIARGPSVKMPNAALSILMKLKSISDKIFLSTNPGTANPEFWKELLYNDFRCLELELKHNKDRYEFEDVWLVLSHFSPNDSVRNLLLRTVDFSRQVLEQTTHSVPRSLNDLDQIIRLFFAAKNPPACDDTGISGGSRAEPSEPTRKMSGANGQSIYLGLNSGAIYVDTEEDVAQPDWIPDHPLIANIQLNSSCNMKCSHCDYVMTGHVMPLEMLEVRLKDLKQAGVVQVNFGEASEALLYPDLAAALALTASLGLVPNLTTNLSVDPSDELWQAIKKHCGAVAVSIDRFHMPKYRETLETHRFYERLRTLVDSGVFVIANTVYDRGDLADLPHVVEIAARLGCSAVCVIRRFYEGAKIYNKLPLQDFVALSKVVLSAKEMGIKVGFHSSDPVARVFTERGMRENSLVLGSLTEARHSIYLDNKGSYLPFSFPQYEYNTFDKVADAWKSETFERYRRATSSGMAFADNGEG